MIEKYWTVRLSAEVENDFYSILDYTIETFGERQADPYKTLIQEALSTLSSGPEAPGSKTRNDIQAGLRSLHISSPGRRGQHFIIYSAAPDNLIVVLRILHDAMDLPRHIPS